MNLAAKNQRYILYQQTGYNMQTFLLLCLEYIAMCGYLIRGGSRWIFSYYFKPDANGKFPDKVPGCRWIGDALTTGAFAVWVLMNGLNPLLIPVFFIGWYLTIVSGWGSIFGCRTLKETVLFFFRMCESVILFIPLALLVMPWQHALTLGIITSTVFSAVTTFFYWNYNHNFKNTSDASFNFAEAPTGSWILACAIALVTINW